MRYFSCCPAKLGQSGLMLFPSCPCHAAQTADFALPTSGSPFAIAEGGDTKINSIKQKIDENLVTLSFISLSKTLVFITDGHYPF